MNKKTKAALAGLAFFAGCEIGIAIQLMKMIHKFTVREAAMQESVPNDAAEESVPEDTAEVSVPEDEIVGTQIDAEGEAPDVTAVTEEDPPAAD